MLAIEGNPLVEYGHAQSVASVVGPRVIGMRFRPLSVSAIGDPAIEAGDPLLVIDRRQRTYRAYATGNTWKHGGFQSLACSAETPARNRADIYGAQTRAIVQQRNAQRAEVTARELAVRNLARKLSEAGGLYKTEQEQQDHSVVYYLHDKPNLAESQIVWKMNSQAFAVSVDGGRTYPFGFDASAGNTVFSSARTTQQKPRRLSLRDGATSLSLVPAKEAMMSILFGYESALTIYRWMRCPDRYPLSYVDVCTMQSAKAALEGTRWASWDPLVKPAQLIVGPSSDIRRSALSCGHAWGSRRAIWPARSLGNDAFVCDAYLFYSGDSDVINAYRGEYMSSYSWASMTEAILYWRTTSR